MKKTNSVFTNSLWNFSRRKQEDNLQCDYLFTGGCYCTSGGGIELNRNNIK